MPASSGGKSRSRQSALIPMPTTTRGSSEPRPSLSPSTPASLRSSIGAARRAAAAGASSSPTSRASGPDDLDHEVVGPLEVDRARREPGDVLGGVAHRQRHRPPRGATPGPPAATSAGSRATRAAPPRRAPSRSGRAGRGPPSARRRPPGRPPARRPRASRARRRWSSRRWRSARRGRTRTMRRGPRSRRQPAAAPAASTVSGCSSSNAAWSARTASSTRSSAMIVVIRISEVEIISMLMPASASVPNMRAA